MHQVQFITYYLPRWTGLTRSVAALAGDMAAFGLVQIDAVTCGTLFCRFGAPDEWPQRLPQTFVNVLVRALLEPRSP